MPVDWYNGGMGHTTLHLLYSRFWHLFLHDIGVVDAPEPYQKRTSHGMILCENGEKMSKSRGNVVNPDDIINSHGADALRLFEMFAGPLNEVKPWSPTGLDGAKRFIERSFRLVDEETFVSRISDENSGELDFSYNAMVKKCTEDYESLAFNTAISAMMVFVNDVYKAKSIYRPYIEGFTKILSCVCPFVGEEMWEKLGHKDLITYEQWPTFDEKKLVLDTVNMVFAVNGKMRDVVEVDKSLDDETLKSMALSNEKVKNFIADKTVRKVIVVKGKIVNVVVG
jgi:leucyl-tRNA synthetase